MSHFPQTALDRLTAPSPMRLLIQSPNINLPGEKYIPQYACLRARLGLAVSGRTDRVSEDIRRALTVLAQLDEKEEAEHGQRI